MKRVRQLHQLSCLAILESRTAALQDAENFEDVESFNQQVARFRSQHGSDWCRERGLVAFPTNDFRFTVVMPVYNECSTIEKMIQRVCAVDLPLELIIVDDGSHDGTGEALQAMKSSGKLVQKNAFGQIDVQLLSHNVNLGKGAALKTGFQAAQGDVVGIQDADQEYDPREFIILISTILSGEADVVYGSRFAKTADDNETDGDAASRTQSPGWHRFGNGLITRLSNFRSGLNVTDAETCYKLIRKSVLDRFLDGLTEKRFGIELEMTAKLARQKDIRFDERPISYDKRTYAEGKKIGLRDAFRALWCILKY